MYIGNTHTKRLHDPSCRAVPTIAPKHVQYSEDGEGFHVLCKWCGEQGHRKEKQKSFDDLSIMDMPGIKVCYDERYREIFEKSGGCIYKNTYDHSNHQTGKVLMYPHSGGVEVLGEKGLWWIYYECECGYQTNIFKAIKQLRWIKASNFAKFMEVCR